MATRRPRRKFGPSQRDRIFFACLPDAETAARIYALAQSLKEKHGLEGTLILPEHLHVTLFHLGDWHAVPDEIVKQASAAAAQVRLAPFEVVFDRAGSFRNRTGVYPFVLTGEKHIAAWLPLHDALAAALKHAGLGGATQGEFQPHITLSYDETRVKPEPVDPISWSVREVVLVHSLLGKTAHIHLGRWPLG
jgi:RNA 2',3'-cyclic 3'-phosphodiesterase